MTKLLGSILGWGLLSAIVYAFIVNRLGYAPFNAIVCVIALSMSVVVASFIKRRNANVVVTAHHVAWMALTSAVMPHFLASVGQSVLLLLVASWCILHMHKTRIGDGNRTPLFELLALFFILVAATTPIRLLYQMEGGEDFGPIYMWPMIWVFCAFGCAVLHVAWSVMIQVIIQSGQHGPSEVVDMPTKGKRPF